MRAMLIAFLTIGVIAVGADIALDQVGFSAQDRATGSAVRLD